MINMKKERYNRFDFKDYPPIVIFAIVFAILLYVSDLPAQSYYSKHYTEEDGLPGSAVFDAAQDSLGQLWFCTSGGLTTYDGIEWKKFTDDGERSFLNINEIEVDDKGNIWIVSNDLTISFYTGGKWYTADESLNYIKTGGVNCVKWVNWSDKSGLAVCTREEGLLIYTSNGWIRYNEQNGFNLSSVNFIESAGDSLVLATDIGLLSIKQDSIVSKLNRNIDLPSDKIISLKRDTNNSESPDSYWILGYNWLGKLSNGKFNLLCKFPAFNHSVKYGITELLQDGIGGLIFGNPFIIYYYTNDNTLKNMGVREGLIAEGIYSALKDHEGNIWLTCSRGINKIPSLKFNNYNHYQGLLEDEVSAVNQFPDGRYIFGHNNGISIYDGKKFKTKTFIGDLNALNVSPRVMDIELDSMGNAWLVCSNLGLARLNPDNNLKWYRFKGKIVWANCLIFDNEGKILIGTDRGFARIVDGNLEIDKKLPQVSIRNMIKMQSGEILFCYAKNGIGKLKDSNIIRYRADENRYEDTFTIYQKKSGDVLVGSRGGLLRLIGDKLVPDSTFQSKIERPIFFMLEDSLNRMWFGTNNGVYLWDGNEIKQYSKQSGLAGTETNRAAGFSDKLGNVWIGTGSGLSEYLINRDSYEKNLRSLLVELISLRVLGKNLNPYQNHDIRSAEDITLSFKYITFTYLDKLTYKVTIEKIGSHWKREIQTQSREINYAHLNPGKYRFTVEAKIGDASWTEPVSTGNIKILKPFYLNLWFISIVVIIILSFIVFIYHYISNQKYTRKLEQKVLERARDLQQSNDRFVTVLNSLDSLVFVITLDDYKIIFSNPAGIKAFGDVVGESCWKKLMKGQKYPCEFCDNKKLLDEKGKPAGIIISEMHNTLKDRWYETHSQAVEWVDGSLVKLSIAVDITDRKKLEEEFIRERKLFQGGPVTVFRWGINWNDPPVYVSPNVTQFGYEPSDFTSGKIRQEDAIHPDDMERVYNESMIYRNSGALQFEQAYRMRNGDGSYCWVYDYTIIDRNEKGEINFLAGYILDITQRKKADEILLQRELQYQAIFNSVSDSLLIFDLNGRIVEANPAASKMFGYTYQEMDEKSIKDIIHPDFHEIIDNFRKIEIDDYFKNEAAGICCDGKKINIDIRGSKLSFNGELHLMAVIQDITGQKQMMEDLKKSEKKFRTLVHDAIYGIYRSSMEGRFLEVNPALCKMLGYNSVEELLDLDLHTDLYANPEERQKLIDQYKQTQRIENIDVDWLKKNGDVIEVRLSGHPIFGEDGETEGFEMIAEDVTDRRKFEIRIQQAQKFESIGVLAGGIAHDFNNILAVVIGNSELGIMALPEEHPVRELLENIRNSAERAADLTKQMLAYSGQGKYVVKPYYLTKLIKEMLGLLKASFPREIEVQTSLAPHIPPVLADYVQLQQIIMNVTLNAAEAIKTEDGNILIETGFMELDADFIKSSIADESVKPGKFVYFHIMDNGEGMDEATASRIFEPFYTTKFTGRGLGLSAVLGIVRGHNGVIKIFSKPGEGTSFKIFLPASEQPIEKEKSEEPVEELLKTGGTILLVDDEEGVRGATEQILQYFGFNVLLAADGLEGVEVFRKNAGKITMVILDMKMPRMNGREAFEEIRKIDKDVKVLLSSGYNEQEAMRLFDGKDIAGFIQKPYTIDALRDKIKAILNG